MDRKMARLNMRFGIALFIMLCGLLAATFVWAAFYLSIVK